MKWGMVENQELEYWPTEPKVVSSDPALSISCFLPKSMLDISTASWLVRVQILSSGSQRSCNGLQLNLLLWNSWVKNQNKPSSMVDTTVSLQQNGAAPSWHGGQKHCQRQGQVKKETRGSRVHLVRNFVDVIIGNDADVGRRNKVGLRSGHKRLGDWKSLRGRLSRNCFERFVATGKEIEAFDQRWTFVSCRETAATTALIIASNWLLILVQILPLSGE